MRPKTQYEIDGTQTTTADSYDLINSISLDTEAIVEVIGYSYLENPIHALTIGNGNSTILISSGVHRNEWLAREAVISKMLDVVYNIDGKYTEYLSSHKVVFIPTVQPDRNLSRVNAQNIDLNRDFFEFRTKEAEVFIKKVSSMDVDIYADFHERSGSSDKIEFVRTTVINPNAHALVRRGTEDFLAFVMDGLTDKGIYNGFYPDYIASSSNTNSAVGLLGSLCITTETFLESPNVEGRYQYQKEAFELILEFHKTQKDIIRRVREEFSPSPYHEPRQFYVFQGDSNYYLSMDRIEIVTPKGYEIKSDVEEIQKWVDAYNIEIDNENYISVNQKSGAAIVHLLENESDYKINNVIAEREDFFDSVVAGGRHARVKYDDWRDVFISNYLKTLQ